MSLFLFQKAVRRSPLLLPPARLLPPALPPPPVRLPAPTRLLLSPARLLARLAARAVECILIQISVRLPARLPKTTRRRQRTAVVPRRIFSMVRGDPELRKSPAHFIVSESGPDVEKAASANDATPTTENSAPPGIPDGNGGTSADARKGKNKARPAPTGYPEPAAWVLIRGIYPGIYYDR